MAGAIHVKVRCKAEPHATNVMDLHGLFPCKHSHGTQSRAKMFGYNKLCPVTKNYQS